MPGKHTDSDSADNGQRKGPRVSRNDPAQIEENIGVDAAVPPEALPAAIAPAVPQGEGAVGLEALFLRARRRLGA
jgi:hypothetical protein